MQFHVIGLRLTKALQLIETLLAVSSHNKRDEIHLHARSSASHKILRYLTELHLITLFFTGGTL
jgi:hypothetical protein